MKDCKYYIGGIEHTEKEAKTWLKDNYNSLLPMEEIIAKSKEAKRPTQIVKTLSGINELERENEIKKRQSETKLSEAEKRESEVADMVNRFNSLRRNDKSRPDLLRTLRVKSNEYGFNLKYTGNSVSVTVKKGKGDGIRNVKLYKEGSRRSIAPKGTILFDRNPEFQKAFSE